MFGHVYCDGFIRQRVKERDEASLRRRATMQYTVLTFTFSLASTLMQRGTRALLCMKSCNDFFRESGEN